MPRADKLGTIFQKTISTKAGKQKLYTTFYKTNPIVLNTNIMKNEFAFTSLILTQSYC